MEDESCYSLNVVNKICVKVELEYLNGLNAEEAEIVTGVKFKGGCLHGGDVIRYKRFNQNHSKEQPATIRMENLAIEVRSEQDPYISFEMVNKRGKADQSFFFWLSVFCLMGAILMIFALGCVYKIFIEEETKS